MPLLTSDSKYPYITGSFSQSQTRAVLSTVREHPSSTIEEIQRSLGYSRGNPRTAGARREISQIVYLLESLGLVQKRGHRFYMTNKGSAKLPIPTVEVAVS